MSNEVVFPAGNIRGVSLSVREREREKNDVVEGAKTVAVKKCNRNSGLVIIIPSWARISSPIGRTPTVAS